MEILLGEKFIYILDGTLKKVAEIKYFDAFFINELKFFDENMNIKIKNFIDCGKLMFFSRFFKTILLNCQL